MAKTYSDELKIKAMAIADKIGSAEASRATGVPAATIRSWIHRGKGKPPKKKQQQAAVSEVIEEASDTTELTAKQKAFIQEYLVDLNATQAAIRAGYNKNSARQIANQNLSKLYIRQAIDEALKEREQRTQITQDVVIGELAKIALTDIKNYLSYRTEKTVVGRTDTGEPIFDYTHVIDIKDSDQVDGSVVSEVQHNKDGTFKFKLHDKKGALELLGKHLKLFTDKTEHTGKDGGPIETKVTKPDLSALSDEELNDLERIVGKVAYPGGSTGGEGAEETH